MVNALTPLVTRRRLKRRLMMNKSLRGPDRESSRNRIYGFRRGDEDGQKRRARGAKKKPPNEQRLLKLIKGRRQTEGTGATRCANEDDHNHKRENVTYPEPAFLF